MDGLWPYPCAALAAYLVGATPTGYLVGRAHGIDIRTVGSRNVGATNVFRCVGKGAGILVFACDALKGYLPAFLLPRLLGAFVGPSESVALSLTGAAFAIVGHNWPMFLKFKGGKGVATSAGALLGLAPAEVGIGLGAWLVVFLAFRYVSLASIVAACVVCAAGWAMWAARGCSGRPDLPVALTVLGALAIWRHKANIQRLLNGTESRFARKPRAATAP